MRGCGLFVLSLSLLVAPAFPRQEAASCGTSRETTREVEFLHRQSRRALARRNAQSPAAVTTPPANRDIGNIAIIEDTDGVVARQNQFNLTGSTIHFTPSKTNATAYRYATVASIYDDAAAQSGAPLNGLGDDDSRSVALPFAFPYFGASYRQVFVNSDGNLTFTAADSTSTDRSLGRVTAGPPRISAQFEDLDPGLIPGSVRVLSDATRVVFTWLGVPEYTSYGAGAQQTFQATLYPDGRIDLSYPSQAPAAAIVGISPGNLQGATTLVSFLNDPSAEYTSTVAERFTEELAVDIVTVAQRFYATHEDAYDYLVIYNNMDIPANTGGISAVAYENTVRSIVTGNGDNSSTFPALWGSASRLQAALNLGPLNQYPVSPNSTVSSRAAAGDTPLTIIGHESGHLFLAFASIHSPKDPTSQPMLGAQLAHWSFLFNSEASLLEGERIKDNGPNSTPRFITTDTVQGYAPLDQYLMGFRPSSAVPPTFLVSGPTGYIQQAHPARNYALNGDRIDITVDDVIAAVGPRIPDYTVAQRRFRYAFILVVPKGTDPSAANLAQLESYRAQFEPFFAKASDNNATADATLKLALKLSLYPAAGVLENASTSATLSVTTAPTAAMTVALSAPNGFAKLPPSVTIPAGATSATFTISGIRAGVEEVTATPGDSTYETAFARLQVAPATATRLDLVSGSNQTPDASGALANPIVVRLTDANRLPYAGVKLVATASTGGSLDSSAVTTDSTGLASFRWKPGPAASAQLSIAPENLAAPAVTVNAGAAVPTITGVVNGASYLAALAPGAFATVLGTNLTGGVTSPAAASVKLNGRALPVSFVSGQQINFYLPLDVPTGAATLTVESAAPAAATARVTIATTAPGIFVIPGAGYGAIVRTGSRLTTDVQPVKPGDYIEIYCTGLGPTLTSDGLAQTILQPSVYLAGRSLQVVYSGQTATPGLYQIDAQIPAGIPSGTSTLFLRLDAAISNEVKVEVQ